MTIKYGIFYSLENWDSVMLVFVLSLLLVIGDLESGVYEILCKEVNIGF